MYNDSDKENIITKICDNVIENKISFNQAVKESEISLVTFYKWIASNKELQSIYNYAREVRSDILFEEIIYIADNQDLGEEISEETNEFGDIIKTTTKKGDMIRQRQLRIDARKWVVAKMQPKKYGDKIDVTTDGEKLSPFNIKDIYSGDKEA